MTEINPNDRGQRLEAAFRKLPFKAENELHLRDAIEHLCEMDTQGSGVMPERYRPKPNKGGRPRNVRAQAVSIITGYAYYMMTGKKPTLSIPAYEDDLTPRGPFFDLLVEVFATLDLKEDPEHFAKDIVRTFKVPNLK